METNCSVTVMPVYLQDSTPFIGFIRRTEGDTFSKLLVAPGGRVELTDGAQIEGVLYHSIEHAAVRELKEETRFDVDLSRLKYFCSLTLPKNGRVVISMYCILSYQEVYEHRSSPPIVWLDEAGIHIRDDFAPGMRTEALLLLEKLEVLHEGRC